ncbi:7-cyano-7-deazaguanine synthase QueC [Pseudomonadota bacterium]|nr:7-cyano-7-deazaguanine synthase QueC [Pseudomonadota bacterium]
MNSAILMFSGGQDSATCLFWALEKFDIVETVGFDYNQRHNVELEVRNDFIQFLKEEFPNHYKKIGKDHKINATNLTEIGETAMTSEMEITYSENGLPSTFVPARNLYFFTLTSAIAYRRNISKLIGGMCETDYSGYPDCRRTTMDALQSALSLGMDQPMDIVTPLMWVDKAQTWKMAHEIGGEKLIEGIKKHTHTCYIGDREHFHEWGYGCGECPACNLRSNGYKQWKQE